MTGFAQAGRAEILRRAGLTDWPGSCKNDEFQSLGTRAKDDGNLFPALTAQ